MSDFGFPFDPWPQQLQFMQKLYDCLDKGGISVFESPTGTGKSLSLICSSLHWLLEKKRKGEAFLVEKTESIVSDDEPDWIKQHDSDKKNRQKQELLQDWIIQQQSENELIKAQKLKMSKLKSTEKLVKRPKFTKPKDDFLLNDSLDRADRLIAEIESEYVVVQGDEADKIKTCKIIYTSRTHSQIQQFISEIRKTIYSNEIRLVSLGSRKQLCINESVKNSSNAAELCLEMQRSTTKCPFLQKNQDLKWSLFTELNDIEDLHKIGKGMDCCPYYGSRDAIQDADLITLPYNLLFNSKARNSLNLDLNNNIIIIDEAHNVIETINSIYSASLSLVQITETINQLENYFKKYENRLSSRNKIYLKQLTGFLTKLQQLLEKDNSLDFDTSDFLSILNLDNLNLFNLENFIQESGLAKKLHGFVELESSRQVHIHSIESLLSCLTNSKVDGKLFLKDSTINYMLLNPFNVFHEICSSSRAVVMAGGTMEPLSDLENQLFKCPYEHFSCGHIVDRSSIKVIALSKGPTKQLHLNYASRSDLELNRELALITINFCNLIPGGVIAFFPSYSYMEKVYAEWLKNGHLASIERKKRVFLEPKQSNQLEATLEEYSKCIRDPKSTLTGALMMCVVGGKLSEGINFSDDLGRGVLMIGMPFANLYSIEIQEKIKYYQKFGKEAGNDFYENLCMKAVNQSIGLFKLTRGRAIRHKKDYACILLLDERYQTQRVVQKLPGWIRDSQIENISSFGQAIQSISKVSLV